MGDCPPTNDENGWQAFSHFYVTLTLNAVKGKGLKEV